MKVVCRTVAVVLILLLVLGCSAKLSESKAKELIKAAWDARFAAMKPNCTVTILGISVEGKTAVVQAEITSNRWDMGQHTEAGTFYFRKYDTGWAVEF